MSVPLPSATMCGELSFETVCGDAAGVSVGTALSELQAALEKLDRPIGYEFAYGGQAQMMAEMKRAILRILAFALFFSFVVLTVQFNSLKLPALILGSVPFCMAGLVFLLLPANIPLGATVIIGVLVVVAATVNEGVLLMTYAEDIRQRDQLAPATGIGGLLTTIVVALFLMPVLYVIFQPTGRGSPVR
jgi:multidrug efflux pump subunit AcrB